MLASYHKDSLKDFIRSHVLKMLVHISLKLGTRVDMDCQIVEKLESLFKS